MTDLSEQSTQEAAAPVRDAIVIERLSKRYRRPAPDSEPEGSRFGWLRPGRAGDTTMGGPVDDVDELEDEEVEEADDEPVERGPVDVWALREIDLRVPQGRTVGLIGPNGSGKTTLLKILARITTPTSGRALLRGRVAPLLELATALLQDDRTARDNVFLLARFFDVPVEVARRHMEEIIDFAELDDAVDLDVRRYSSGLKRRLAFSAVLNLQPDILLADEILSVGDAAFKNRCLERVEEAARNGLTTLFASHDLELVRRLCHRVVWLEGGRIVEEGETNDVVDRYERQAAGLGRDAPAPAEPAIAEPAAPPIVAPPPAPSPAPPAPAQVARPTFSTPVRRAAAAGDGPPRSFNAHVAILGAQALDAEGEPVEVIPAGEPVRLELSLEVASPAVEIAGSFVLNVDGRRHLRLVQPEGVPIAKAGFYAASVEIPGALLPAGRYEVKTGVWVVTRKGGETALVRRRSLTFDVVGEKAEASGPAAERADLSWSVLQVQR